MISSDQPAAHQAPQDMTAVIRRRIPKSQRRRDGLLQSAYSVHSQNGEDGILDRIFSLIPPPPPARRTTQDDSVSASPTSAKTSGRWCVDVGAWDGKHLSNTHELLHNATKSSWRGVLLEADPDKFQQLSALYKDTSNIVCLNVTISAASPQDPNNLCQILPKTPLPAYFDFLCIDIDGSDYWVWHDILVQRRYQVQVVCIEFNPTMPNDLIYIPPREQRHGASLAALVELGEAHGYVLVETTVFNAFFVEQSLYEHYLKHIVPDTSIEALHENTMGTSLYQLYDGTIKLWGCKKLLWHRIALDEKKLQILPEEERIFPFAPTIPEESPDTLNQWMERAVDLSVFRDSTKTGDEDLACRQLLEQLERDGFALVRGTGVEASQCRAALEATNIFLQDADESIRRSCLSPTDRARRGYAPMNVENFASLLGQHGPNDLVRKFRIGPSAASTTSTLLQPNIWPPTSWDQAEYFRTSVESFYESACHAAENIVLKAICAALVKKYPELNESLGPLLSVNGNGSTEHSTTTSILTLLGYRTGTRHKGKNKGALVAAHTDVGVITMLLFDGSSAGSCAGLQRSDGQDGWVDIDLPKRIPDDPIFVINVADCLSDLSQNRLPSTVHRVVANRQSKIPRNCCALFVGLDPAAELTFGNETLSYEEWRRRRIERSQRVLREGLDLQPN